MPSFIEESSPLTCGGVRDLGLTIVDLESFQHAWNVAAQCPGFAVPAAVYPGTSVALPGFIEPQPSPVQFVPASTGPVQYIPSVTIPGGHSMIYKGGIPVTQAHVGDTVVFNVPGYSSVWLYQLKDGVTQWNGPYNVPSQPYTFTQADIGHYDTYAYQLISEGAAQTWGTLIESGQVEVLPVGTTGGDGGILAGVSTTTLLLVAAGAFLLLRR